MMTFLNSIKLRNLGSSATMLVLSLGAVSFNVKPATAFFLGAGVDALRTAPVNGEMTSFEIMLPQGFFGELNGTPSDPFSGSVKFDPWLFEGPPEEPQFQGPGCHGLDRPHQHCTETPETGGELVDTLVRRINDINIVNSGAGGMGTTELLIEELQLYSEELDITFGGVESDQVEQLKAKLHLDPGICNELDPVTGLPTGQQVDCDRTGFMKVTITGTELLSPTEKVVTFDIDSDINVPIYFEARIDEQPFGDPTDPVQIEFESPNWIVGATAVVDPTDPRHATVPEPTSILAFAALGLGATLKRKKL